MVITIKPNKKTFPSAFFIGLLLSVIFFFQIKKPEGGIYGYYNVFLFVGLFLYSAIFTILAFYNFLRTLFYKNATLTISDIELNDNLSIFSCGKIPRTEISNAEILRIRSTNYLAIKVADSDKYLADRNFIKGFALKLLLKKFQTPIVISEKRIDYNLADLRDLIQKHSEP